MRHSDSYPRGLPGYVGNRLQREGGAGRQGGEKVDQAAEKAGGTLKGLAEKTQKAAGETVEKAKNAIEDPKK